MNYKTIAKFIKDRRSLTIWDTSSEQWITDGIAAYPVLGMPRMNENEMIIFLGLEKERDKISVSRMPVPSTLPLGDMDTDDEIMNVQGVPIIYRGELCRTYITEQGVIACCNKYISIIEKDAADTEPVEPYIRVANGSPFIAIMSGLELFGLVLPVSAFESEENEKAYQKLADGLKIARLNFGKNKKGTADEE